MNDKSQTKSRKHPTCSRCRFHGKKDIRVLQHQCPFRNCTCSSCFLIKRRSIIYRAQKTLDKTEDLSNDSSGTSSSMATSSFESNSSTAQPQPDPQWPVVSAEEPCKEFRTLCLTFPEVTRSQLRSVFDACGNDFQRTIDTVLMSTWCEHEPAQTQSPVVSDQWSSESDQWPNAGLQSSSEANDWSASGQSLAIGEQWDYGHAYYGNAHFSDQGQGAQGSVQCDTNWNESWSQEGWEGGLESDHWPNQYYDHV